MYLFNATHSSKTFDGCIVAFIYFHRKALSEDVIPPYTYDIAHRLNIVDYPPHAKGLLAHYLHSLRIFAHMLRFNTKCASNVLNSGHMSFVRVR